MEGENSTPKPHRKRHSGPKAERKKKDKKVPEPGTVKPRNPKAFAFQSAVSAERAVRRGADILEKKHHIPLVDRSSNEPPPVIVAVVGPPKVGKSTLIRCLVRNYTKRKLTTIQGPVTIVSGKKQRITFIKCNNDINCMIDIAKVADLVLLLVDASFGFEMEIFEFLHICKVHGEPKVIGVLTHLDMFENNKSLKKTKKQLKNRFWKDVYQGAKLFYLSGMVNSEYQKTEIHNLGRFISVMKYRPLQWRTTHPYVVADRMEDVTDPELMRLNPKIDRSVCLYGYVRGVHFRNKASIHIPGAGDFCVQQMSCLPDPCPLPEKLKKRSLNEKERLIYAPMSGVGGILYDSDAIYIDIGGSHTLKDDDSSKPSNELLNSLKTARSTMDDKIASSRLQMFSKTDNGDEDGEEDGEDDEEDDEDGEEDDDEEDMDTENNEDEKGGKTEGRKRRPWKSNDDDDDSNDDDEDDDDDDDEEDEEDEEGDKRARKRKHSANESEDEEDDSEDNSDDDEKASRKKRKKVKNNEIDDEDDESSGEDDDDDYDDDDPDDEGRLKWKDNLKEKGIAAFLQRQKGIRNMQKFVYGGDAAYAVSSDEEKEEIVGGLFEVSRKNKEKNAVCHQRECVRDTIKTSTKLSDEDIEALVQQIKDCFMVGKTEDAKNLLKLDGENDSEYGDDDDDPFDCDDDDMGGSEDEDNKEDDGDDGRKEKDDDADEDGKDEFEDETPEERRKRKAKLKLEERKKRQKAMFDSEYDEKTGEGGGKTYYENMKEEMAQQSQLNKSEYDGVDEEARIEFEGFRPGLYVRIQVNNVPCEFVKHFNPTYPVIVGGLLSAEQNIGYVTTKIKKHRWYKKILKTKDPIVLSLGWRRFQSIAVFSIEDHNCRHRQIKYTPAHLHCHATFWGPITPQGTGVLAVQSVGGDTRDFRLLATGAVSELDKAITIVKKLKLIGTPFLIHKNTAFIKGMFNSSLEVAKFELASIRTVSGIRGQIKKSVMNGSSLLKKGHLKQEIKPGSFRATFEDKILLSDIVFLRTWYRTDVPQFYNPVTTLLLPAEERDQWQGMKTVGQLLRERNIRRNVNTDSLYKPIERQVKEAKPLVIPRQLQKELPFKDKPKYETTKKDPVKRIAVVQEPKEQQISRMMKRMKAIYESQRKQKRVIMRNRAASHQKAKEQQKKPKSKRF